MKELIAYLADKRIAALGYGVEGKATVSFIAEYAQPATLHVWDRQEPADLPASVEAHVASSFEDLNPADYDLLIKSPGIATYKLPEALQAAPGLTDATGLFLRFFGAHTIGITGTKGKSTTSTLLHAILSQSLPTVLGGNIGKPLFSLIPQLTPDTWVVAELSSHQLENVRHSAHIGIILNLFEEHLDAYRSRDHYFAAKWNLFRYQQATDHALYDESNANLARLAEATPPVGLAHLLANLEAQNEAEAAFLEQGSLQTHPTNLKACLEVARLLAVPASDLLAGLAAFQPLPHRLEKVGTYGGVTYYNDSIATIPAATLFALRQLGEVETLLLGGFDRGIDYAELATALAQNERLHHLLCFGASGRRMADLLASSGKNVRHFDHFDTMVHAAMELTTSGICLLSPAAPSYGDFKNFEERGERFRALVSGGLH